MKEKCNQLQDDYSKIVDEIEGLKKEYKHVCDEHSKEIDELEEECDKHIQAITKSSNSWKEYLIKKAKERVNQLSSDLTKAKKEAENWKDKYNQEVNKKRKALPLSDPTKKEPWQHNMQSDSDFESKGQHFMQCAPKKQKLSSVKQHGSSEHSKRKKETQIERKQKASGYMMNVFDILLKERLIVEKGAWISMKDFSDAVNSVIEENNIRVDKTYPKGVYKLFEKYLQHRSFKLDLCKVTGRDDRIKNKAHKGILNLCNIEQDEDDDGSKLSPDDKTENEE